MGWEILLSAALEAGLSLLAEAGFGDEARDLKERLTKRGERERRAAFELAFNQAAGAAGESLQPLLEHRPFREAVIAGLLDPVQGFDLQSAAGAWGERLPAHAQALRRFFSVLENALLADESWGPVLERYQALRFRQEALAALRQRGLDVPPRELVMRLSAKLSGSGGLAQGRSVAAGAGGVAVGRDVGQIVQVIIQELRVERGAAGADERRPESVRRCYLAELARETNRLPWTAVERDYADPERGEGLGLSEVYTALDTTELERVEREEELRRFLTKVEEGEARRIPAQEMVDREARLLILGDPGSGKSTLVNHLAYTLAQAGLAGDPAPWLARMAPWSHGPLLPVRVELGALAAGVEGETRGSANLLLGHLRSMLNAWQQADFWPHLDVAIRGDDDETLLILLDGLDEVPAALRGVVVQTVQDFADRYGRHRYLVTCRPYAYVGQPWTLRGFREVTLAPFSQEQVDHFVTTWYRELARRGRLSTQEAEERAGRLRRAVRRGDLGGLARRPLLLTVMTLLHSFRGQLPDDRTELYADAVDLLLRRWEGRVGGESGILERLAMPGLKMSDLEAGLYEVAFAHSSAVQPEGTADVDEGDLRGWLAPYLGDDWNKAGQFVAYIRERAGLLVRHKTEAYTFPHRTFQEFMAACHLVGLADYPAEAARRVREEPDRWREVFILAAGHAARTHRLGQAIAAVNALCPGEVERTIRPDAGVFRRAALAGEALLEVGLVGVGREEPGRAALERVRAWLAAALRADQALDPRERAAAGNVLARLGDPRPEVMTVDGMQFCYVPPGPFLMGSDKKRDRQAYDDELPQHEVTLPTYYIARYPVTNAQYRAFVEVGGYRERRWWTRAGWEWKGERSGPEAWGEPFDLPNHPVVGVSWYEAVAFCNWLTEQMREWANARMSEAAREEERDLWEGLAQGRLTVRLPSEAEWEKAARGGLPSPSEGEGPGVREEARIYPWGDEPDPNRANYYETGIGTTSAVGCFPGGRSPYGVEELSGNVWEWCATRWQDSYADYEDDNTPEGTDPRVVRGGSFASDEGLVRCAARDLRNPFNFFGDYGFRVVVAPVPSGL